MGKGGAYSPFAGRTMNRPPILTDRSAWHRYGTSAVMTK